MSEKIHLTSTIPAELSGKRLDQALAQLFPEYSRARLQHWIKAGWVRIDDDILRAKDKVHAHATIVISAELSPETDWHAQDIALDIVHEDDDLIVINKPQNLVVHPAAGNPDNTLVNALLYHCPELSLLPRAGIVHRIDKDTTGLLVVAKNLVAHHALIQQLQERTMHRTYQAIVCGVMTAGGEVDAPIGRHPKNRLKMAVTNQGKPARTHYRILQKFRAHTHIQVDLETGRTHQIRVHMAHIHYPLVGDQTYGGRLRMPANATADLRDYLQHFKRQALHAAKLALQHPSTGEFVSWQAPLPEDMQTLLNTLAADNTANAS